MRGHERVGMLAITIGIVALIGLLSVCTGGEDDQSLGRLELVSHERDRCYGDECYDQGDGAGGYGSDYGHNRRDDRNRNRGAFSPGPFDRSPVDFSNSCISLDCSGREKDRDEGRRPASLFPVPTPDGVRQFVLATIEGGIGLGKLFANATIDFVSSLMVGIA